MTHKGSRKEKKNFATDLYDDAGCKQTTEEKEIDAITY
jgi:hypothetical protein